MNEQAHPENPRYHFSTIIPTHYNDTVLRVLPCNPHLLFVYWDLPETLRDPNCSLLLRISECRSLSAESTVPAVEIAVQASATGSYFEIPFPGLTYSIQLCRTAPDGSCQVISSVDQEALPSEFTGGTPSATCQTENSMDPDTDTPSPVSLSAPTENIRHHTGISPDSNPRLSNRSSWSLPGQSPV